MNRRDNNMDDGNRPDSKKKKKNCTSNPVWGERKKNRNARAHTKYNTIYCRTHDNTHQTSSYRLYTGCDRTRDHPHIMDGIFFVNHDLVSVYKNRIEHTAHYDYLKFQYARRSR